MRSPEQGVEQLVESEPARHVLDARQGFEHLLRNVTSPAGARALIPSTVFSVGNEAVDAEVEVTKRDEECRARVLEQFRELLTAALRALPGNMSNAP